MYLNTFLVYIQKQLRTIKITFNILPHLEMKMIIWKILLMSYITACHSKITTPIVFWHGMGGNNSRYLLSKSLLLIKPPNISFFFSKVLLAMWRKDFQMLTFTVWGLEIAKQKIFLMDFLWIQLTKSKWLVIW